MSLQLWPDQCWRAVVMISLVERDAAGEKQFSDAGEDGLVARLKRILRVDSDEETDNLHTKYKETARDREHKLKMFEQQLNIKVSYVSDEFFEGKCIIVYSILLIKPAFR